MYEKLTKMPEFYMIGAYLPEKYFSIFCRGNYGSPALPISYAYWY